MMMPDIDLSKNEIEGNVREGIFAGIIAEAEVRQTKHGDGMYLRLTIETDGGVKVRDHINLVNPNQMAERIGRDRLKTILHHAGLPEGNFTSTQILLNARVTVQIVKDEGQDGQVYPKVKRYLPLATEKGLAREPSKVDQIPF